MRLGSGPANQAHDFVEFKDHMMDDSSLRLRELSVNAPQRYKLAAAVAIGILGLIFLLKILGTTSRSPVAKPVQEAKASAPTKPPESARPKVEQETEPMVESKPLAVDAPKFTSERPIVENERATIGRVADKLYAEYPELDPASDTFRKLDDWEKVTRLRDFAYRHTAFANNRQQMAYRAGALMVQQVVDGHATLADAYDFFDRAQGGVLSGEAAELLQRLYASLGYEAFCLEIGMPPSTVQGDGAKYALDLVRIKVPGPDGKPKSILSVQDPSLNVSYGNPQNLPIDYFEMLEQLVQQHSDEIRFIGEVPATTPRREPITVAADADLKQTRPIDFVNSWNLSVSPVWSAAGNGSWIAKGPRSVWAFERSGETTWKPALFQAGLPPESIYLHCFPGVIEGNADGPALLKQAQQVLSHTAIASATAN